MIDLEKKPRPSERFNLAKPGDATQTQTQTTDTETGITTGAGTVSTEITLVTFGESGEPEEKTINMPKLPAWTMAREIGYEPKTTFWDDFSIADLFGPRAVLDTFRRAVREWRHDVEYIAELVLVLNHKGGYYHNQAERLDSPELARVSELYYIMWEELHEWAKRHYTGDDAEYYFKVTD